MSLIKKEGEKKIRRQNIDETRRQLNIFDAAEEGNLSRLQFLVEDNPSNVYKTHESGLASALHYACRGGHYECAALLLEKGARPNSRTASEETPLHYCAEFGHTEIVKLLLSKGGDPTLTNYYRMGNEIGRDTVRDVAVYFKRHDIVAVIDEYLAAKSS